MMEVEKFIKRGVLAKRLGVSIRTIDNWAMTGVIPSYRLGRTRLFHWAEIEKMIFENAQVGGRNANGDLMPRA